MNTKTLTNYRYKFQTAMLLALTPFFLLELSIINMRIKRRKDTWYFMMHGHLGDVYCECSFMQAFKETWGPGRIAVLVHPKYEIVPKLFSAIDEVIPFDTPESFPMYIGNMMQFHRGIVLEANLKGPTFDWKNEPTLDKEVYKFFNAAIETKCLRGVPINSQIAIPIISESARIKATALFKKLNLIPHKTVLLFPYTHDEKFRQRKFWELLVQKLKDKGYRVLVQSKEQVLDGTENVYVPLDLIIPFVEKAGWVIAVISGMVDFVSSAKCNKTILYPYKSQMLYNSRKHYRYPNKLSNKIDEFLFENDDNKELVEKILKRRFFY